MDTALLNKLTIVKLNTVLGKLSAYADNTQNCVRNHIKVALDFGAIMKPLIVDRLEVKNNWMEISFIYHYNGSTYKYKVQLGLDPKYEIFDITRVADSKIIIKYDNDEASGMKRTNIEDYKLTYVLISLLDKFIDDFLLQEMKEIKLDL